MALKADRSIVGNQTDISYFYNSTAEKGEVLVFSTAGSGAAMDDANAVVTRPTATPSGERFAGIVLNDVVNKDLTQTHINFHKDEVQQGGKVTLLRGPAVIVTDMIESGVSPTVGDPLYIGHNGRWANTGVTAYDIWGSTVTSGNTGPVLSATTFSKNRGHVEAVGTTWIDVHLY